jgi:hypothetical protein
MDVFTRCIKHPNVPAVQCPHEADARKHRRAVIVDNQKHRFDRGLPFLELLFGLRKLLKYLAASSRVTSFRPRGNGIGSLRERVAQAELAAGVRLLFHAPASAVPNDGLSDQD